MAASAKVIPSGLGRTPNSETTVCRAKQQGARAITSSPTANFSTPAPTATTRPAALDPQGDNGIGDAGVEVHGLHDVAEVKARGLDLDLDLAAARPGSLGPAEGESVEGPGGPDFEAEFATANEKPRPLDILWFRQRLRSDAA